MILIWDVLILTFSSSFFTVLRFALKSMDSLCLAPSRAPSMASADTLTLFSAGLFILPFNSKTLWFKSAIYTKGINYGQQTNASNNALGIFNGVLKQQNIPPFHFWKLLIECHIVPHQQHQFFDEGLCTDSVSRALACKERTLSKELWQKSKEWKPVSPVRTVPTVWEEELSHWAFALGQSFSVPSPLPAVCWPSSVFWSAMHSN